MSEAPSKLSINDLTIMGKDRAPASLTFSDRLNVIYGASNTGKTFTFKTIDFMLGGRGPLPDIGEKIGYESCWIDLTLPLSGRVTLRRALAGGGYELYENVVQHSISDAKTNRSLSARHDATDPDNISQYLLTELGLTGRQIAIDVNGKKRALSFRDLVRFCLVDETAMQGEASPVESGQYTGTTAERSVLKLLLTGEDDSAVVSVMDRKTFKTSTTAKLEVLDELLATVNNEIEADFPDIAGLADQNTKLEETLATVRQETNIAQQSIREKLVTKGRLARLIYDREQRRAEIQINFGRFEQLADVYRSDIRRLEAIEEAGFVLALAKDKPCPLCGASPKDQHTSHGMAEIEKARDAANAEIEKIKKQQGDLDLTIEQMSTEGLQIERSIESLQNELKETETQLERLAPFAESTQARLTDILAIREHVRHGLELLNRRDALTKHKADLSALKPATKADRPHFGVPGKTLQEFAQTVSSVLAAWRFPGNRVVTFDDNIYDLKIDGKNRRDNGKGVRAVTHSAFKVALLIYCKEHGLPHPGFLVLDTPLLTYRDPIQTNSPLSADEEAIKGSSLKEHFFSHLSSISEVAQIIVVENIDLPSNIKSLANVETFTGDPGHGRYGLFPYEERRTGETLSNP